MDAAARRRTYDIPKSDSVGLAEWTSKIKALQRQVDEDEEAETRRLEEEIMVSRMSRMRRSTLQPRASSHDPSANKLSRVASPSSEADYPQSIEDKQRDREATMRKLMGQRSPVTSDFPRPKTPADNPPPALPKPSSSADKPRQKSISLAALMGSRETGPRMNKHAPQQDAHDPTQFEQRRSITSPHPVFGKNGVAMPGLAPRSPGPQSRASPRLAHMEVPFPIPSTPPLNLRERKTSTPAVARRHAEKIKTEGSSKPLPSPRLRDTREHIRERTMSTPSVPGPSSQRFTSPPKPLPSGVEPTFTSKQSYPLPQTHNSLSTPTTPNSHRHSYTPRPTGNESKPDLPRKTFPSTSQLGRTEADLSPRSKSPTLPVSTPNLRRSPSPSMMSVSPSRPATTITTPTLARPAQPKLNPPLHGPKIISFNRSPAFFNRTPPKGVTPSLSRLQGRGFVQNMVKVSAELESSTGGSPASTPERIRPEPQKKTSVLDRWPGAGSAIGTPMAPPTPVPMRKAKTLDPISNSPGISKPSSAPKPISIPERRSRTSEKGSDATPPLSKSPSKGILVTPKKEEKPLSITPPATSNGHLPGVGSSNTLVSYVKPMKTGDSEPSTPVRSKTPTVNDGADELGIRKRKSSGKLREKSVSFAASPPRSKAKSVVGVLPSPGKSLSHPTKDRAKKPKRVKITAAVAKDDKQPLLTSRSEILPNVAGPDPPKAPNISCGPTIPPSLPKYSPATQGPPSLSPITLVPISDSQHRPSGPVQSSKSRSPSPQPPVRSSGETIPPKEHSPSSTRSKITDKWGNGPIIGVKPVLNGKGYPSPSSTSPLPTPTRGNFGQVPLPGLSMVRSGVDKLEDRTPPSPVPAKEPLQEKLQEKSSGERKSSTDKPQPRRPPVPHKPSRIPSTGKRPTVMDVAQVWSQHEGQGSYDIASPRSASPSSPFESHPVQAVGTQLGLDHQMELEKEREREQEPPEVDVKATIPGWGIQTSNPASSAVETIRESEKEKDAPLKLPDLLSPAEKRKSSWEKYSEFIMPPLEEEWTPVPTPTPTFNKPPEVPAEPKEEPVASIPESRRPVESKVDYLPIDLLSTTLDPESKVTKVAPTDLITFDFPNHVVPQIDVRPFLNQIPKPPSADPGVTTVSVDVLSIVGSASSAISSDTSVFYDAEILAIVWRAKVKSSGLVETRVWGWIGKDARVGPKEEKALAELAKRYGTKLISIRQYDEPVEMVTILGGTLAIRQGTRAHWSPENTAMHLVRSINGITLIDEKHLSAQNLCSGFSYCLSILQMFYVWNGRGARPDERKAAFDYAASLCGDTDDVNVLNEDENDEDEMFWAILGDGDRDYAKASYWGWRASVNVGDPQLWKVSASLSQKFTHVSTTVNLPLEDSVFVLDGVSEVFILVGAEARGKREDIRLAIATAKALVSSLGPSRPFVPPIHALVFPSQVPRDLRLAVRGVGFDVQDGDETVEHMNILSVSLALGHLNARQWHKAALADKTLLPLGLSPNDID